jgi:hypothetical protein
VVQAKIYELRIYWYVPGRMPALLWRFENETLRFCEKHRNACSPGVGLHTGYLSLSYEIVMLPKTGTAERADLVIRVLEM